MKTYNTIQEAILNAVLPEEYRIKQEQFKTGENQNKWLSILDLNPPKTESTLTRLSFETKQVIGHCCLGAWCYNSPSLIKYNNGDCMAYNHAEAYLPKSEKEALGLVDDKGMFIDDLALIVFIADTGERHKYNAVFRWIGIDALATGQQTKLYDDAAINVCFNKYHHIASINDSGNLLDHKTMAQFIRNFSSVIFEKSA